ncbi:hydantoinase/oxoprolinase family protein [Peribacillus aracenensis]|uniref:hydantoinase/oxoprolinase family protein n=1 Tax=Peribacillus aracenensis TaxID=2976708 RepID=UPI0021A91E4D|nr:hydantoinase/oxoprolinase family protein [Peribacillus sp. BBB004]
MADSYHIGIDMGGTFTDIVVINHKGEIWTDKADTTPNNLIEGLLNSIENVSNQMGVSQVQLLHQCTRFVHGTTIVTNSIAELKGAKVGLLVTRGFKDTLRIARSPRTSDRDHHKQSNMPNLVERNCILEINERLDKNGRVVVEMSDEEVLEAVKQLVEVQNVETIAVTFLWSFLNDIHEQRVKRIIELHYPSIYVSISCEVHPVMREYERMNTTTLNAFTGPKVVRYVDIINQSLEERGLNTPIVFIQSFGGSLSAEEVRVAPIKLVDSGPIGGVLGANYLGKTLGITSMITGDMGGTSFDCSIIQGNKYTQTQRVYLREFLTGLSKIDVTASDPGGGSIAWIDSRGIPQVGPQSASSYPGPISYGRGGEFPTVTDANVILGFIDPAYFLGGRMNLEKDKAEDIFRDQLAAPLKMSVLDTAASIYQLVIARISSAIRSVSVERGHDPKDFTFVSYGGALPLFTAEVCREIGIKRAVIPASSAVFSAQGLLAGDDVRSLVKSSFWRAGQDVDGVNNDLLEMEEKVTDSLIQSGFERNDIQVQRFGDFKFEGQMFEISVPLPSRLLNEKDLDEISKNFAPLYEAEYGPGTAWIDSEVILLTVRVTGIGSVVKFKPKSFDYNPQMVSDLPKKQRSIYLPMERKLEKVVVYNDQVITPGTCLSGPAIIERSQTTIFIPNGASAHMDDYRNYVLEM